ncbi:MAG: hypothetical protein IJH94_00485, partial [Clostridia bacterium]|nr:hypothetical protein [Clostridia bacterium]
KLELGLIFVTIKSDDCSFAEIIREPEPFVPVKERRDKLKKILRETDGRAIDNNIGGVTKRRIATAFTERNIFTACVIEKYGTASPKLVKDITGADCAALLSRNFYGWFSRVEKGVYTLTDKCRAELSDYPELTEYYRSRVNTLKQIKA